jgi:uncharacterized protein (DUF362 family)
MERKRLMDRLYIANGSDGKAMATRLLEAIKPETGLEKNASIALKPNLVVAKSWKSGATTNPAVCEAVIEYFFERGYRNICIMESSWLGCDTRSAFKACGYDELSKRLGVELVDLKKDAYAAREYGGMRIDISKRALEADFLVNLPLIKGHCQTKITCALKNMKGVIPDREKRRFHSMGLHKPVAYLGKMISPSLTIADGIYTDPGFEEGGNPHSMNVMAAGTDSVLIDAYAAKLLGYKPYDIEYIRIAEQIGAGSADLRSAELIYIDNVSAGKQNVPPNELEAIKTHIEERDACSACYANVVSALRQLGKQSSLGSLKVCVGQGFKGESGEIGSGDCTAGFTHCIKGCPPDADSIKDEIIALRSRKYI